MKRYTTFILNKKTEQDNSASDNSVQARSGQEKYEKERSGQGNSDGQENFEYEQAG